jgi:TP901 family phage tail tape measure protein
MALDEIGQRLVLEGAADFVGKFRDAQSASKNFTDATDAGGGKVSKFGDIVTGALQRVGAIALDALGKAAGAVKDFVGDSIKVAGDYEASMNVLGAALGGNLAKSGVTLDDLNDTAMEMGAKYPVTASQVVGAMTNMAKGGFDPLLVKGPALEKVLQLSAAAQISLDEASDRTVKTYAAFTDASASAEERQKQLNDALEITYKVAAAGTGTFPKLNDAMLVGAGAAKALNIPTEDYAVTMGFLTDRFPEAAMAGTGLKNVYSSLTFRTKEQYAMAQKLGIVTKDGTNTMFDSTGAFKGNANMAQVLQDAFKNLTAEQKNEAAAVLFGNDAKSAGIFLAEAGAKGLKDYAANAKEAASIEADAAAKQKGWNTALENVKGSIENVQIVLGRQLLPVLTDFFNNYLAPGINKIYEFAKEFGKAADKTQFLKDAIERVLPGFGAFMSKVGQVVGAIINLAQNFDTNSIFVSGYAKAFENAKETIGSVIESIKTIIGAALKIISEFWDKHAMQITVFVMGSWLKIQGLIGDASEVIRELVTRVFSGIAQFLKDHGDEIQKALDLAWKAIKLVVETTIGLIKGILTLAMGIIKGDWSLAWEGIQKISDTVWESMKTAIDLAINAIKLVVITVLKAMGVDMDDIMAKAKAAMQKVWDAVKLLISLAMSAINKDTIEKFTNLKDKAVEMLEGLLARAKSIMDNVRLTIVNAVIEAYNGITKQFGDFVDAGKKIIERIVSGINSIGGQIASAVGGYVASALQAAWDTIKGWLNSLTSKVNNAGQMFGKSFDSSVQGQNSASQLGGGSSSTSVAYANNYNLNVNSAQSTGTIVSDFSVMASLYGN